MVFSSLEFVFIFMPLFFGCYYAVPDKIKNFILFLGSLCFYFMGTVNNPEHFILFVFTIVADFFIAINMEKHPVYRKPLFAMGLGLHLVSLAFFKYSGFVLNEFGKFSDFKLISEIVLPIGISFYTFQGISYLADVYRKTVKPQQSLMKYTIYISMFAQLIAGPIVTYGQVEKELSNRKITTSAVFKGLATFIFGLGMKVLLANPLGKLWSQIRAIGFESISTPLAWMAIIAFSFQIYFDFFGYSLMAMGLGKMLGFKLPENFNHPYISRTMTEFWRRWHITLGNWFKEYVYIPLGGNRNGNFVTIRNLFIVWILTGIWHGAGYNFILWGIALFVIILTEKFLTGKYLNKMPVISRIYMFILISVTWAIFAIEDIGQLAVFLSRLFPFFGQGGFWSVFRYDYLKYLKLYYPFFIAGILFSVKLPFKILKNLKNRTVKCLILIAIFCASVYCMYKGFDDPFLYFRF